MPTARRQLPRSDAGVTFAAMPQPSPSESTPSSDPFLRDIWYFALPSAELKPGAMRPKTLLGEPILLGRAGDGTVFAMRDICPHRGIPLSDGRLDRDEVECCYHGWRFGTDGRCTAIPSLTADQAM